MVAEGNAKYIGGSDHLAVWAAGQVAHTAGFTEAAVRAAEPKVLGLHDVLWNKLHTRPGLALSAATRVRIAIEARSSRGCPVQKRMKAAPFTTEVLLSGYTTQPEGTRLPPHFVDLIHRTMNDAGRMVTADRQGEEYYSNWCQHGSEAEYVEVVAVCVMVTHADTLALALGVPLRQFRLADASVTPATGTLSPLLDKHCSWVPTMRPELAEGLVKETYGLHTSNIMKQLSALPDDHRQFSSQAWAMYFEQRGRSLTGPQVEFIAAVTSKINDCAF